MAQLVKGFAQMVEYRLPWPFITFISGMQMGSVSIKKIGLHLTGWLLLLAVWYFLRYQDFSSPALAFKITLLKVVDLAMMVYISNLILIPVFLYKKKYISFGLLYLGMILSSSILKMKLLAILMQNPGIFNISGNIRTRIYDNVIPHFFLVTAGVALKLFFDHSRMQQRIADMAREKAEAELHFLKSQINPHFLFNSLNAVYFLIDKENALARKSLHTFSEMLRFQLYGTGAGKIPIEKEVAYLEDYISLQRLRLNENSRVQFNKAETLQHFQLEPFLLLPLVENAFKHLSHFGSEKQNEVNIDLSRINGHLRLIVENTREQGLPNKEGGIGLANVRRRLQLLYPGNHQLQINEEPERFRIQMEIPV